MGSIENNGTVVCVVSVKVQLHPPGALGGWHVLLRLESLNPARLRSGDPQQVARYEPV